MTDKPHPHVILVEPQMGENIGMCARAMLNCGLRKLRLVAPRDGWPQESARATAADADEVLASAEVFTTVDEAIADCRRVYATTARERSLSQPVLSVGESVTEIRADGGGEQVAVLFGPEASGLDREAVSRADKLVRFDTNPGFPSLNLAQAVLLFGWEWRRSELSGADRVDGGGEEEENFLPARREQLAVFLGRLNRALEDAGFFLTEQMRPHTEQSLRALFARARPTDREIAMLQGVLSALSKSGGGDAGEE